MTDRYLASPQELTLDFFYCIRAAMNHLISIGEDSLTWFGHPNRPAWREHLAFGLGNQLFFIHIETDQDEVPGPSPLEDTIRIAQLSGGIPCLMRMTKTSEGWAPENDDWNLVHALTQEPVIPTKLVTDELIEISDWEVYDLCVEHVCRKIEEEGGTITSSDNDPDVIPSIWFDDKDGLEHFVCVFGRRLSPDLEPPESLESDAEFLWEHCDSGFYTVVLMAGREQDYEDGFFSRPLVPMYRGDGYQMFFNGLEPISRPVTH